MILVSRSSVLFHLSFSNDGSSAVSVVEVAAVEVEAEAAVASNSLMEADLVIIKEEEARIAIIMEEVVQARIFIMLQQSLMASNLSMAFAFIMQEMEVVGMATHAGVEAKLI